MEARNPVAGRVCDMCHRPRALVTFITTEGKNGPVVDVDMYCIDCTAEVIMDRAGLTLKEALK